VRRRRTLAGMKFIQYYLECLSQASYLIADETSGLAAVVDPRRDVQEYLDDAAAAGSRIAYVIETHVHADFLSGHLELAQATGATVIYGAGADVRFTHHSVADFERIALGQVVLEFRATPGHTPESISVVVWDGIDSGAPYGVLTGDTLFIGDVGRPDLSSSPGQSAAQMARRLHSSLHAKLLTLPDDTRVYPAHGAGSACGKNLSTATTSTIGEQRRTNYALRTRSVEEFVEAVREGQSPPPDYFAHVAALNRETHQLLTEHDPPRLSLDEVIKRQAGGAIVLDVRSPEAFARGHVRRSLNVGLEGRFAEYAADVVDEDADVIVVCPPGTERQALVRLSRVGLDSCIGFLDHPGLALAQHPDLVEPSSRVTAGQLAEAMRVIPDLVVLDVRSPSERAGGAIDPSLHIPIAQLRRRLGELDSSCPVVAYCAGGYRSSIAASLMRAAGSRDVSDLIGGYLAWSAP
jgi:hydroxyacylglutathione hydrolase